MSKSNHPELFIIGLGVMIPGHITKLATDCMSRCVKLFAIVQEPTHLWLPQAGIGRIEVVNLLQSYVEGNLRTQNYERATRRVIDDLKEGQSVGYVTYGNPMAYDSVAQNLVHEAKKSGFRARVIPGISSVDTIFCDLGRDMAPAVQIFDASWLLACGLRPQVTIPTLLLQMGTFGSFRTHYTERRDGSSLSDLVSHLGVVYPSRHPVSLIRSTSHHSQPAKVTEVSLENLGRVSSEELSGASLYIPAVQSTRFNEEMVQKMIKA
jgi:precorrin-3B methylase